ncbi:MAG: hypothetical protein CMK91_05270 [Pseudomonas sp.]|jgi:hypothetical protein|nr:hypothetical protein [Pseudomonas sp.]|tara:strand:- start:1360 stop:1566 length:207 start_codon:yes stop_codon:yes gene_type:complete
MKASHVALALYIALSGLPGASADDQRPSLSGDDLRIDEDGPEQDELYDEDDQLYDEADDYEDHEDGAG